MVAKKRLKPNEIVTTYLLRGTPGISDLDAEKGLTVSQVRRAIKDLEEEGSSTTNLEEWLFNTKGVVYRPGNVKSPLPGTEKHYKAIKHANANSSYARVPLNVLGIQKGGTFKATFEADKIIITKP